MPEFLTLLSPDEARDRLFSSLPSITPASQILRTTEALGRVTAEDIRAPHRLPEFPRSTVDGYAVRARDTFGASDSLPVYLELAGEVPMGGAPLFEVRAGQCGLIHTGGMLPDGADAAVMLEHSQSALTERGSIRGLEIEILRAVGPGENVIAMGEDAAEGQLMLPKGRLIRPAEVGGLMALGILQLSVAARPRVALISTGDEVVPGEQRPIRGQVRDINSHTLGALVARNGGEAASHGILPDQFEIVLASARRALDESSMVVITAGSSASTRDMTSEVIRKLGAPGVLVHGINTRPGKPTILGVCDGKPVIGLPGNPVSALVNGYLFVVPVIDRLLGALPRPLPTVPARLMVNLPSQAGREDWWPVRLLQVPSGDSLARYDADPIFGKSNLIFNLVNADGLLRIPPEATGLHAGETVEVRLLW